MICFKYSLNQDSVELQASDWSGLERVYVNGEMVSSKLNFGGQSEHQVPLKDGNKAKFQLFIDPQTEEVMCRIYKKGQLVASLKQGQENLSRAQNLLWQSLLGVGMLGGLVMLVVH
ncbi:MULTISPECIES: hypothetical protein [Shewanella]|uniref:hypothetical protein n=1 Tax=Shewanella TaxID=22 RepID=UPI001C655476|nr:MULTISPECIES: hypothetical protein [Shewanella]QYJ73870.1 hypothetical protein K0H79_10690 [Shewanella sp. FJAT-52076]QYK03747.1 hypothetical protein K0H63_11570 [Shewanella zhangzhouensis]